MKTTTVFLAHSCGSALWAGLSRAAFCSSHLGSFARLRSAGSLPGAVGPFLLHVGPPSSWLARVSSSGAWRVCWKLQGLWRPRLRSQSCDARPAPVYLGLSPVASLRCGAGSRPHVSMGRTVLLYQGVTTGGSVAPAAQCFPICLVLLLSLSGYSKVYPYKPVYSF